MNRDGSLSFECQHGPTECNANIYHACTIEAIEEPKVLLDMIACMIKDNVLPKQAMIKVSKKFNGLFDGNDLAINEFISFSINIFS